MQKWTSVSNLVRLPWGSWKTISCKFFQITKIHEPMTNTLYTSAGYGRLRILHWKCSGLSDVNEVETLNDGHNCSLRRKSGWDVSLRRKMGLLLSTSIKNLLDGTTWYPDSKKIFVCLQSLWVVALLSSSHWSTHDIRVGVKRHFSSLVLWLKHTLLMPGAPLIKRNGIMLSS